MSNSLPTNDRGTTAAACDVPENTNAARSHGRVPAPHLLPELSANTDAHASRVQLEAFGLTKTYRKAKLPIPVLRGVNIEIYEGEFLAIVGQSGSGKSTLLHLLGTLDAPDSGEVRFCGQRIDNLAPSARNQLRNKQFGMIFQAYHLLPELSMLENVLAPVMIAEGMFRYLKSRRRHTEDALRILDMLGLAHRTKHRPRELSGGEMQRTAIGRALINNPSVLLADEPTGNLDHATGAEIIKLLRTLNRQHNLTIVMVSHDPNIARQADRVVRLADGQVAV